MRSPGGRHRALALAVAAALLALSGCSAGSSDGAGDPGETDIVLDSPRLQQLKEQAGIETCEPGEGEAGSNALPELTLECLGGGDAVDLSTLEGPLLINLWASWCGPCREELPVLQEFHEQYPDQVTMLGIDLTDLAPDAAIGLAEVSGVTYPQLADPAGVLYEQDDVTITPGLPGFILIDADGEVVVQTKGGLDSLDEVVALVEDGLGTTL